MVITLTTELEELVNQKVRSGAYHSADEVITASLQLLSAQEQGRDALRREIMLGVADIREGRATTCSSDAELGAFAEQIIRQGEEGLRALGSK